MEPPDAAVPRVYSFHLRDARVSSPFRIHLYSATFIIAPLSLIPRLFSPEAKTHTAVVVLLARRDGEGDHVQIMGLSVCTIYCPPPTRFLYKMLSTTTRFAEPQRRGSGNLFCIIARAKERARNSSSSGGDIRAYEKSSIILQNMHSCSL
jgi:hypothetical protein